MKVLVGLIVLALPAAAAAAEPADKFSKPSVGMLLTPLGEAPPQVTDQKLRWPTRRGLLVASVVEGTPASKAGIKAIDIVTHIDGAVVDSPEALAAALDKLEVGKPAQVKYQKVSEAKGRVRWRSAMVTLTPATQFDVLSAQVTSTFDDVTGVTTYKTKEQPEDRTKSELYCWLAKKDNNLVPFLGVRYGGDGWLFVTKIILSVGNEKHELEPPYSAFSRDNSGGLVWEWCELPADASDKDDFTWKALAALRGAEQVKVTYIGKQYRHDRDVTPEELQRLALMLDYFEAINK